MKPALEHNTVSIPAGSVRLEGDLYVPPAARGVVVFAHGSGSSRHSPRNRYVAQVLNENPLGTLLVDLLSADEEQQDRYDAHLRFDIELLTERLGAITDWLARQPVMERRQIGYFGASTGAAAALAAAAARPQAIHAIVSRGGRPDLAGEALPLVRTPTLFIVGGEDTPVIHLNRKAMAQMSCATELKIVPGATHLFEEPGALEEVARLAQEWFQSHLQ